MTLKNTSPEMKLVLAVAKEIANGDNTDDISSLIESNSIDWLRFRNDLARQGLSSISYVILKRFSSLLPCELTDALRKDYVSDAINVTRMEALFLRIHENFEKARMEIVPIKGIALLRDIYEKYAVRSCSDIDVLVKEDEVDKALALLERLGIKRDLEGLKELYWRSGHYHFMLRGFNLVIELHWGLDYPRKGKQLLPKAFDRLRELPMHGKKIKLLSVEDSFFTSALHQRRHRMPLPLKDICDMALFLNKNRSDFDWNYVLSESKRSKSCSTVYFALYQVYTIFGIHIPPYVLDRLDVPKWKRRIIRRFIDEHALLPDQYGQNRYGHLERRFLLYDSIWELIKYTIHIPQELFARIYGLAPYAEKTNFLYKIRIIYMPWKICAQLLKAHLTCPDAAARTRTGQRAAIEA